MADDKKGYKQKVGIDLHAPEWRKELATAFAALLERAEREMLDDKVNPAPGTLYVRVNHTGGLTSPYEMSLYIRGVEA